MTDFSNEEYVWIIGMEGAEETERARFFRRDEARIGRDRVPASQLQRNVDAFLHAMSQAIATVPYALSGYSIDSIEISAEISASGRVSLLGSGGEVAGKGGIAFTLRRTQKAAIEEAAERE